jgi:hypothetical protein
MPPTLRQELAARFCPYILDHIYSFVFDKYELFAPVLEELQKDGIYIWSWKSDLAELISLTDCASFEVVETRWNTKLVFDVSDETFAWEEEEVLLRYNPPFEVYVSIMVPKFVVARIDRGGYPDWTVEEVEENANVQD